MTSLTVKSGQMAPLYKGLQGVPASVTVALPLVKLMRKQNLNHSMSSPMNESPALSG